MATTEIDRMPEDCDFDIDEICKDIRLQNSIGNKLKKWSIESDKITLEYE
ncbi:MAG: hypothetical protein PVG39_14690 [Desulfobacteraceae bacterium]|jgi:hypothetical protein